MRFARPLSLATLALGMFSTSALAQDSTGFGFIWTIIIEFFAGLFNAIGVQGAIGQKIILFFILFIVLFVVFSTKIMKDHRNAAIVLSLIMSLGMIAPLPDSIVTQIFGVSGLVSALFFLAPIIGLIYLSHNITKDHERVGYVVGLLLWGAALFYISTIGQFAPVGPTTGAKAVASAVAVFYVVMFAIKAIGSGKQTYHESHDYMNYGQSNPTPAEIQGSKADEAAKAAAREMASIPNVNTVKSYGASALGILGDIQKELAGMKNIDVNLSRNEAWRTYYIRHVTILDRHLARFENQLVRITTNKEVMKYLKTIKSQVIVSRAGGGSATITAVVAQVAKDLTLVQQRLAELNNPMLVPVGIGPLPAGASRMDVGKFRDTVAAMTAIYTPRGVVQNMLENLEQDLS